MSSFDTAIEPAMENSGVSAAERPENDSTADTTSLIQEVPEHVEALLQPVSSEMPVGQDPRYGDAFYLLKTEIDKLADNDYAEVLVNASQILTNEGKDLRVAGYFMLAASYVHGVQGLLDGITLYKGLLERFGRYCFPAREQARNTALLWLNNKKLPAYVEQHVGEASRDQLEVVIRGISEINTLIADIVGDDHIAWTSITERVVKAFETALQKPVEQSASDKGTGLKTPQDETPADLKDQTSTVPSTRETAAMAAQTLPENTGDVSSEQEFSGHVRSLMTFLSGKGDLMRAAALARATRWGNLQTPPNESGRTRLPAPRIAGVGEIKELLSSGDFINAWRLCESMLFEPGCHVLLDLQWYAVQAAQGMQRTELAALVEAETAALVRRLPGLSMCRFEDDTPFAQAQTQRWLTGLSGKQGGTSKPNVGTTNRLDERVARARETASEQSLAAGLAILDEGGSLDSLDRFQLRMEMAVLCMDHQRAELALPVLKELSEEAQRTYLCHWNRELALTLARNHQDALRLVMSQSNGAEKKVLEQQINELAAEMCTADLVQAADILQP